MTFFKLLTEISIVLILLWLAWMLAGCSEPAPLGGRIDKQKSERYFYGWNKKKVYFKQYHNVKGFKFVRYNKLEDADGSSFTVLQEKLGTDNRYIFYETIRQDQLDRASFHLNTYGSVCDKNGVYTPHYNSSEKKEKYLYKPVEGADPLTFRTIYPTISHQSVHYEFAQDDSTVFVTTLREYQKTNMHSRTFRILNQHFAMDKDSIYFFMKKKIDAIPIAGEDIQPLGPYLWNGAVIYAMEKYSEKWRQIPVKDIHSVKPEFDVKKYDAKQKENIPYLWVDQTLYLWDELYHYGPLDMATFINYRYSGYYKDKDHVYYREENTDKEKKRLAGRVIQEADPVSFEPMESGVFRDKDNIYMQGIIIKDVDADTFEEIEELRGVFRDKDHVYASESGRLVTMKEVDPKTFKVIDRYANVSHDKYNAYVYIKGSTLLKPVKEVDGATFRQLKKIPNIYADKQHVYYYNKETLVKVEGADPITFDEVMEFQGVYKDKNRVYFCHNKQEIIPKEIADPNTFHGLKSHGGIYQDDTNMYFYNGDYLALIKGGMHIGSMHSHPTHNSVYDKYGYFIGGKDGERIPNADGERNFKMLLNNAKEIIRENRRRKE